MSMVSELIREAPAYKKAVLAVVVTAGVGACVYLGYRQLSGRQTSSKPRGPSKPEEKPIPQPRVKEPSVEKEELLVVKPEPVKIDLAKSGALDRSVLTGPDVHRTASPLRVEELSTSVTFEKISLGAESDNFEHVTMSQINPLASSPAREVKKKEQAEEEVVSSSSFFQLQGEAGHDTSLLKPPDSYENLSVSQADPSISFISTTEEEQKEEEAEEKSKAEETKLQLPKQTQALHQETEEAGGSSNDEELTSTESVVSVKDENDIVVVETGSENSEEETVSARSGMAAIDTDFDSSRVSPVFGHQTYQRVSVEPEELATFDPAKSHPASFGFKFESNI